MMTKGKDKPQTWRESIAYAYTRGLSDARKGKQPNPKSAKGFDASYEQGFLHGSTGQTPWRVNGC